MGNDYEDDDQNVVVDNCGLIARHLPYILKELPEHFERKSDGPRIGAA